MASNLEWHGDEVARRLDDAVDGAVKTTALRLQGIVQQRLSRIGWFKSFDRQATDEDRSFVESHGFVDPPGGSPRLRSGRLRRAISTVHTDRWESEVGVQGGLEYAAIHEFGGPMPGGQPYIVVKGDDGKPTVRFIKRSTAARLGKRVRYTKPYNMPARPFLRPSLRENAQALQDLFAATVRKRMEGG